MQDVVIFTPTEKGGHAQYSYELFDTLSRRSGAFFEPKLRVRLVSGQQLSEKYRQADYTVLPIMPSLPPRSFFSSKWRWAISRLFYYAHRDWVFLRYLLAEVPRGAIIHLQEISPWWAPAFVAFLKGRGYKVGIHLHNARVFHRKPIGISWAMSDRLNGAAIRKMDFIFVHSELIKREALVALKLEPVEDRFHVAPHGIWRSVAAHRRGHGERIVEAGLIGRRVLFFGVIRENKGLHNLLDAMLLGGDFSLTIAGAPEEADYYAREITPRIDALMAAGKKITVVPRYLEEAEILDMMQDADFMVLPYTNFKGQSGVLFYAIGMALPTIVTDSGALGDTVRTYGIGVVSKAESPQALADAISTMTAMPADAFKGVFARAQEAHSWEAISDMILQVYRQLSAQD